MKVWCLLIDHENRPIRAPFKVGVSANTNILKKTVKDKVPSTLANIAAAELEVAKYTDSTTNFLDRSMLERHDKARKSAKDAENEALLASLDLKDASYSFGMFPVKSAKIKTSGETERARPVRPRKAEKAKKENMSVPRRQSSRLAHLHASPDDTPTHRLARIWRAIASLFVAGQAGNKEEERLAVLELCRVVKHPRHGNPSLDALVSDEDDTKESISSLRDTLEAACKDVHSVEARIKNSRNILSYGAAILISMILGKDSAAWSWDREPRIRGRGFIPWLTTWRKRKISMSCIKFGPTDALGVKARADGNHSAYSVTQVFRHPMIPRCVTSFTSGQSTELLSLASTSTLLTSFDIAPCGNETWISDGDGGLSLFGPGRQPITETSER
ncbi:uncharacterized protein EI90DRAFT_3159488 [Cantharellus anzutake]|uniref:uncharacterized protein n=1 Tax=Cantharellus anzutake TaxID=1750568 RepID=UPI00190836BB|nr:uncharacterized protein EI90DRAFT_3159488 [Cantharellus anzutake]KAF8314389.1 hypothetical protein EI90DRAFT_3159488 [Cantharellus anzutake]